MSIAAKNKIGLATSLRLNWKHLGSNQLMVLSFKVKKT